MSAVSLLFSPGERPDAGAIAALARSGGGFSVSLDPPALVQPGNNGERRWLELLVNGLTFDLIGLIGGKPAAAPPEGHRFGLPEDLQATGLEAITLQPGPHLASGGGLVPVVRSLAALAAQLTPLEAAQAVVWHPARCWSAPAAFREGVSRWIEGGVFPAFSLASLAATHDHALQSEGLALFTGQELRLESDLTGDKAKAAKVALRLLHWLYENGPLAGEIELAAPDGSLLRLVPSANGRFVRAHRA